MVKESSQSKGAHRDDARRVDSAPRVVDDVVDGVHQHRILIRWEILTSVVQGGESLHVSRATQAGLKHARLPVRTKLDRTLGVTSPRHALGALEDTVLSSTPQAHTHTGAQLA